MDRRTKRRLLRGLVLLLILINLSAIATFGYNKYMRSRPTSIENEPQKRDWEQRHQRIKLYVKKKLELDSNQFNSYCKLKDENIGNSREIIRKIGEYQKSIIAEINKTKPDSLRLLQLSDSVGIQHKYMQMETNRHFLAIKLLLNAEQSKKFGEMLNRMEHDEWIRKKRKYHSQRDENEEGEDNYHHRNSNQN